MSTRKDTIPVDRGWAWVILLASFLNLSLCSISQSAGVFNMYFLQYYDSPRSIIAACGGLQASLITFSGPIASFLIALVGPRQTILIGATCTFLGFSLSFFATTFVHVFITYGFMTGLGLGLCYATSIMLLGFYFKKYRNMAYGIVLSAMGLGMIGLPPVIDYLFTEYHVQGTMLILGGVSAHMYIVALLVLPVDYNKATKEEVKYVKKKPDSNGDHIAKNLKYEKTNYSKVDSECVISTDKDNNILNGPACSLINDNGAEIQISTKSQKHGSSKFTKLISDACRKLKKLITLTFILYSINCMVVHIGLAGVRLHFAAFAFEQGTKSELASLLVTVFGVGNTISRLSTGLLSSYKKILMYVIDIILCSLAAVVTFLTYFICVSYTGQITFSLLFSLFGNGFQSLLFPMAIDIVGLENFNMANGIILMMNGVGLLIGPPLAGLLYDVTGTYFYTFMIAGGCYAVTALLVSFVVCLRNKKQKPDSVSI